MPFTREYNEPAQYYPVYNHCLSITEQEFTAVAYAFLGALSRIGAGNPKGVRIADGPLLHEHDNEPLLVMDRYLTPLGKRPIISPAIINVGDAITAFSAAAFSVYGETRRQPVTTEGDFQRWVGDSAMHELQRAALAFTRDVLQSAAGV